MSTKLVTSSGDSDTTTGADSTGSETTASVDTTTSTGTTDSAETGVETTTSVETMTELDTTTGLETTSSVETTTGLDTTTAEITTGPDTTTTGPDTTTSLDTTTDIDTTTGLDTTTAETTTSLETTTDVPTTTTSAEGQPTVLFADDDFANGHRGESRRFSAPFDIYMYGSVSSILTISVSGDIRLGTVDTDPQPKELPSPYQANGVFGYWSESTIVPGSGQGITYSVLGEVPERSFVLDCKVFPDSNLDDTEPDHYTVAFFEEESKWNYCEVRYFHTHEGGEKATIGNQGLFADLGQYHTIMGVLCLTERSWG